MLSSGLLRLDSYQINEGAARALLMVWSVADRVISPIVVLGIPDFRALLFIPLALYWPGSILASKVLTMILVFVATTLLYHWSRKKYNEESALIASGLLLISPLLLMQVDTLGAGAYLFFIIAIGHWMNNRYRSNHRPLGGWFFLQMLSIAIAVSIHPLGLAYPLALLWEWWRNPINETQQRHYFIGIGIATTFPLLVRGGWDNLSYFNNPITTFANSMLSSPGEGAQWLIGLVIITAFVIILLTQRKTITNDLIGKSLLLASAIGLLTADSHWALIIMVTVLFYGAPLLLQLNKLLGKNSFAGHRGLSLFVIVIVATLFMQMNKSHQTDIKRNILDEQNTLIMTLAEELAPVSEDQEVMVISQWPGRTMLAIRRPVMPLPPTYTDADTLLKNIRGTTHLIFDPKKIENRQLQQQLASVPAASQPLSIQPGGVILALIETNKVENK